MEFWKILKGLSIKKNRVFLITSIIIVLSIMFLCGCNRKKDILLQDEKINIVCTISPVYEWINQIIGDNEEQFSVTLLGDGGDLHSFQPTAKDISKIYSCDLLISVGGITESWMEEIKDLDLGKSVKLFDFFEEGDFILEDADAEHHKHNHNHEHNYTEYDEHIWLSLKMAEKIVNSICDEICSLDSKNGVYYRLNTANYSEKLKMLDAEYREAVASSKDKIVVFADRFPFSYMMKDYGITAFSAFPGCSSDMDASFETVASLFEKVKAYEKNTVLVLENSNETVADAINAALDEQKVSVAVMDSCQTIGNKKLDEVDYLNVMKGNLEALKRALK